MLCLLIWNCTKKQDLKEQESWKSPFPYALDLSDAQSIYLAGSSVNRMIHDGKLYKIVQDGEGQKSVEINWLDENGEINMSFERPIYSIADLDEDYILIDMGSLYLVNKTDGRLYRVAGITGYPDLEEELQFDTKGRVYINTNQTKSYRITYLGADTEKNSLDLFTDRKLQFTNYLVFGPGHLLGARDFHASGLEYDKLYIRKENGGWIEADVITGYTFKGFDSNLYFFGNCNTNFTGLYALILNTTDNTVTSEFKRCYDIRFEPYQVKIVGDELIVTHGVITPEQGSILGLYASKFNQDYQKIKTEVVRPNAMWNSGHYNLFSKTVWYDTSNNKKIIQLDLNNLTEKTIDITELTFITSIVLTPADGLSIAGYANGDPNKTIIEYNKDGQKIKTTVLIQDEPVVQMIPLN